ncbi:MAG: AAA family ATPase [Candidatus Syntrophoarchaeum sp.]|nr:AAA family ATPase [Candidatus Syntrophoarchaeum sp.]
MKLKKIEIKNFKSLKDCSIDLRGFNVVVGPNASGKTNLVELFKLLRKIYVDREPFPFLDWWGGYDNVVWDRKEELPITVKLFFESDGYNFSFETFFTGVGGKFQILKEVFEIDGILTLEREGEWVRVKHDEQFFEEAWEKIQQTKGAKQAPFDQFFGREKESLIEQSVRVSEEVIPHVGFIRMGYSGTATYHENLALTLVNYQRQMQQYQMFVLEPAIRREVRRGVEDGREEPREPFSWYVVRKIPEFIGKITILRELNIREMKEPYKQRREVLISEDGINACNILYNLFLKENKLPDRIDSLMSYIFPDTSLRFELMSDGRVLMKVFEKYATGRLLELYPPGISDGFYKLLTVLTALESEPSLLVVDEVENSLHAKALELIIDELKENACMAILTTHSPVVVDMVSVEDLILVEKSDEGSVFRKTEKPEEMRKELSEAGITLSERWLYGKL